MTEIILYTELDGSCKTITPTPNALNDLTIEEIAETSVPEGRSWRIATVDDSINDQTFYGAWVDNGSSIDIDMPKARDIHMQKLRFMRDVKLKELDIETMKGIDVQTQKQVLRDLPENTDLSVATTPEELKVIMPAELL